jgi:hypothetical protein
VQKASFSPTGAPHFGQPAPAAAGAACAPALTEKYLFTIMPFIPITVPVLMMRSAMMTEGGLFVMTDTSWVRAKIPPHTSRYHIE